MPNDLKMPGFGRRQADPQIRQTDANDAWTATLPLATSVKVKENVLLFQSVYGPSSAARTVHKASRCSIQRRGRSSRAASSSKGSNSRCITFGASRAGVVTTLSAATVRPCMLRRGTASACTPSSCSSLATQ